MNQTIIAGQSADIVMIYAGGGGTGRPRSFAVTGAGDSSEGTVGMGTNSAGWAVDAAFPADGVPLTARVTAGKTTGKNVNVYINAPDSHRYWQVCLDVVGPPPAPPKQSAPALRVVPPGPPPTQAVKIALPPGLIKSLTRAAAHFWQGETSYPNVPLLPDPLLPDTLTGTVPLPLPGFVVGKGSARVMCLKNGGYWEWNGDMLIEEGTTN